MNMTFRDYRPEDYSRLKELWDELGLDPAERGDTEPVIRKSVEHGGKLLLLELPGSERIIGSSWMTFDGRRLYMHHFGIAKEHQRKGLGMLLLIESLKYVKAEGYQVKLEVHEDNIAAKKLYEKAGFSIFNHYDVYMIRDISKIDTGILHDQNIRSKE